MGNSGRSTKEAHLGLGTSGRQKTGQQQTYVLFLKKTNGFEEINISNLNSGIYFVKKFKKKKWIGVEKLVVV